MVHMVAVAVDELGERHKGVALPLQRGDHRLERLRGIFCAVVTKDDAAVAEVLVLGHGLNNGVHAVILPVEAVYVPLDGVIAAARRGGDDVVIVIAKWRNYFAI